MILTLINFLCNIIAKILYHDLCYKIKRHKKLYYYYDYMDYIDNITDEYISKINILFDSVIVEIEKCKKEFINIDKLFMSGEISFLKAIFHELISKFSAFKGCIYIILKALFN